MWCVHKHSLLETAHLCAPASQGRPSNSQPSTSVILLNISLTFEKHKAASCKKPLRERHYRALMIGYIEPIFQKTCKNGAGKLTPVMLKGERAAPLTCAERTPKPPGRCRSHQTSWAWQEAAPAPVPGSHTLLLFEAGILPPKSLLKIPLTPQV